MSEPDSFESARDWPTSLEIDGFKWASGPDPDDAQWWAENGNVDWHDQDADVPEEDYDRLADEAEAQDRNERGLI